MVQVKVHPTPPSGSTLDAVTFADAQHGWAAGKGIILGTDDGGTQWAVQYSGGLDVKRLDSAGSHNAWAVAASALLGTSDGGAHWAPLGEPAGAALQGVDFVSPTVGFGVTSAGLVQTADGGRTWAALPPVAPPPGAPLAADASAAPASAAVAPSFGSATPPVPSAPIPISAVCFSNASDGWAAANPQPHGVPEGEVLRTTDGGRTWTVSFAPSGGTIESVAQLACSGSAAWVELTGDSGMMQTAYSVFRTEDDGATWSPVLTINTAGAGPGPGPTKGAAEGPGLAPGPLAVAGPAEAYFFGEVNPGGCGPPQPVGTTDGGATWITEPVVTGGYTCSVLGGYPDAAFVPGGHGWLVAGISAKQSAIFTTSNGGGTWAEQYPTTALEPLKGIDFISATQGFGLGTRGDGGAILATTDGGRTWIRVGDLPAGSAPGDGWISFANARDGWAAAGDGALLFETTDGGVRWTAVSLPKGMNSQAGVLLSPSVGCIGGGHPLCTTDGGATWTTAAGGVESAWTAAAALLGLPLAQALVGRYPTINQPITGGATGPDSAWMSDALAVYTTTDAGAAWSRYEWPAGIGGPAAISFTTPKDGWMLNGNGGLFATTDGGAVWTQLGGP